MKASRSYLLSNPRGLTVTNAALLVKMVKQSECDVSIGVNEKNCSARSILAVLSLRIEQGDFVTITAEGVGADELVAYIGEMLCRDKSQGICFPAELNCAGC